MNMTIEQLGAWMADFVQIGYMTAIRAYEPASDELRLRDIEKWCKATFTDYGKLKRLIDNGVIRPHRNGAGRNSPLYFSKAEIKQAIIQGKLSQYITDENIKNTVAGPRG